MGIELWNFWDNGQSIEAIRGLRAKALAGGGKGV